MVTNIIEIGGQPSTADADDILYKDGGLIKKRGPIKLEQDVDRGFKEFRQHNSGQGGLRPMVFEGEYPAGLYILGTGKTTGGAYDTPDPADSTKTGYGYQDHGGGAYCNLSRDRENVVISDSFHFGLFAKGQADAVSEIHVYCDTQGWMVAPVASWRRSFFEIKLDLLAGTASLMGTDGNYHMIDAAAGLPGFNQNKGNLTYMRFTYKIGDSYTSDQVTFGGYIEMQLGGKIYDLRGLGGGSAKVTAQAVDNVTGGAIGSTLMESFAGGRNPGFGVVTPIAGQSGGIYVHDWKETIADEVAA